MTNKKPVNPFYVVLLLAGTVFALTACAYGVMATVNKEPAAAASSATSEHTMISFMERHGVMLMMIELAVLGIATFAAIGTDEFWTRRAERDARRTAELSATPVAGSSQPVELSAPRLPVGQPNCQGDSPR